jgi:hypothetical protein
MRAEFFLAEKKPKCDEYSGRILLGDDTKRADGHATANQVPVVRSLIFNWNPTYIHTQYDQYAFSIQTCATLDLRHGPNNGLSLRLSVLILWQYTK